MESDVIRIGKISSIDYPKGTARITYEDRSDSTTAMFSFLAWQYWMPHIGDQVIVAHLSNGSCAAVILGPVWHDGHRPPEGYEGLYRHDYNRQYWKAYEKYDNNTEEYIQPVTGDMRILPTESWNMVVGGCEIHAFKSGNMDIQTSTDIEETTQVKRLDASTTVEVTTPILKITVEQTGFSSPSIDVDAPEYIDVDSPVITVDAPSSTDLKSPVVTVDAPTSVQVSSGEITITASGSIHITAPGEVFIDAPTVHVTGDVVAGNVSLMHHVHTLGGVGTEEPVKEGG